MNEDGLRRLRKIQFKNFISLGGNCSVAMELRRIKLRDASYPFDWVISEWTSVLKLCENGFEGFLSEETLLQNKHDLKVYLNSDYGIYFYHDFNEFDSLGEQINAVRAKYQRRITRFYKAIKKPTLFIRYIRNQVEADIIESNYSDCLAFFQKFNPQNELIFIKNDSVANTISGCFTVESDVDDVIARTFLSKNKELNDFLNAFPKKREALKALWAKVKRKISRRKSIKKEKYIHDQQYE